MKLIPSDRFGKRLKPGGKGTVDPGTAKGRKALAWLRRRQKRNHRGLRLQPHPSSLRDVAVKHLLDVARSQIGVGEQPAGSNSGQRVRQYQAATSLKGTGWPWCAAFVVWCCGKAGVAPLTRSASVPEWEREAKLRGRWHEDNPQPGDAVIFDFDPATDTGVWDADHIGIVEHVHPDGTLTTIEGNTTPPGGAGSQANGGGVWRRARTRNICRGYVRLIP